MEIEDVTPKEIVSVLSIVLSIIICSRDVCSFAETSGLSRDGMYNMIAKG